LIENDVAFRDRSVFGGVNGDLVCLQTVSADANVDVAFVDDDARVLRSGTVLLRGRNLDLIRGDALHTTLSPSWALHGLICIKRIDVGSIRHRIRDFAIDRIGLLREYKLASKYESYDSQRVTGHRLRVDASTNIVFCAWRFELCSLFWHSGVLKINKVQSTKNQSQKTCYHPPRAEATQTDDCCW